MAGVERLGLWVMEMIETFTVDPEVAAAELHPPVFQLPGRKYGLRHPATRAAVAVERREVRLPEELERLAEADLSPREGRVLATPKTRFSRGS